jgi:hypothetical protein
MMTHGVKARIQQTKRRFQMASSSEELPNQVADTATGAAAEVVEAASDPAGTTARTVRRLERRGAPINRHVQRQVRKAAGQAAEATGKLLDGTVAEDLVIRGLHLVKSRARRRDLVGEAAFRSLELLHGGFGTAASRLSRFQAASQPPVRKAAENTASRARTSARQTTARARKTA